MLFSSTAEKYVVDPIETMLEKLDKIAKNPLEAQEIEYEEIKARDKLKKETSALKDSRKRLKELEQEEKFETRMLEKTIIKIGALLALGFGEAGSNIIQANIN